jgi:hypothetical protein
MACPCEAFFRLDLRSQANPRAPKTSNHNAGNPAAIETAGHNRSALIVILEYP